MATAATKDRAPAVEMTPEMLDLRRDLDQRLAELRTDRTPHERDWRLITHYIVPNRGRYMVGLSAPKPRATSSAILDPTATKAHQRLAAFCHVGITNPAVPWFKGGVGDDDVADNDDVRAYLAECDRRMYRVLASGTFYNAIHQVYEEVDGFGTGVMLMLPDFEDVVRFTPLTTGEYFLAVNDRSEVDELHREYAVTVKRLVQQFGIENVSDTVRSLYENNRLSGIVTVVHAIRPNPKAKRGRIGWQHMPWTGVYYERGQSGHILKGEGFDHQPFIAPRWHALDGDAYGTGPGHAALPDVRSLQAGVAQLREAAEKMVSPPMQADSRYQQGYLGLLPGDLNWLQGLNSDAAGQHAGIRPVFTVSPQTQALQQEVEGYRAAVKETYFNDMILAISQMEGVQPRNQMEIAERRTEKMLMLGPVLTRFYSEALGPVIRFLFSRMQKVGIMPPPPPQLHGRLIEPSFVSVLAQAQKSVGTTGIEALLRLAGAMAGVWPGVREKIDGDAVVTRYAENMDVPQDVVVPQDKVDAMRQAAARQQQQAAMAQQAQQLAQGAQTLSQTDVGGGQNALSAMLGNGPSPQ